MPSKKKSKTITVREHQRRVPVSEKNPTGVTVVDWHLRHIEGRYLDLKLIEDIFQKYDKRNISYPSKGKTDLPNEDKYDDHIAVWVDYFNRKLQLKDNIDPNMIKALIASESTFNSEAVNKNAIGLTQVTKDTLKILQDLDGEVRDFTFKDIRQKDLKDPNVSIALGVRWLAYKKLYAETVLRRPASSDEVIQVYKGILGDSSKTANAIMAKYRAFYDKLKKK